MTDLTQLDLTGLAQAIAGGDVSAVEVMRFTAERAERLQPKLACFIATDFDRALDAAKAADAARSRGDRLGPLHGVPVAHKDMYYRAGQISDNLVELAGCQLLESASLRHERVSDRPTRHGSDLHDGLIQPAIH